MSGPLIPFALGYFLGRKEGGFHLFGSSFQGATPPAQPVSHHVPRGGAAHHVHPNPIHVPDHAAPQGIPMSAPAPSSAVHWTSNAPTGLPPFPSGWRPTATTPPVIARAVALLGLLPVGETKYERGGPNGWIAYHATTEAGKKYVTAWEPRSELYYETTAPPVPSVHAPVQPGVPVVSPVVVHVPPAGTHHPQLSEGMHGPDVVTWQQRLGIQPADGAFGPHTKAVTIAFQNHHGLQPDGIVGPLTWAASETASA